MIRDNLNKALSKSNLKALPANIRLEREVADSEKHTNLILNTKEKKFFRTVRLHKPDNAFQIQTP